MTIKVKNKYDNWVAINTRQISFIEEYGDCVLVYCTHGITSLPVDQFMNVMDAMNSDD